MILLCTKCGADITHADCDCRPAPEQRAETSHMQRVVELAAGLAEDGRPTMQHIIQAAEALRGEPS